MNDIVKDLAIGAVVIIAGYVGINTFIFDSAPASQAAPASAPRTVAAVAPMAKKAKAVDPVVAYDGPLDPGKMPPEVRDAYSDNAEAFKKEAETLFGLDSRASSFAYGCIQDFNITGWARPEDRDHFMKCGCISYSLGQKGVLKYSRDAELALWLMSPDGQGMKNARARGISNEDISKTRSSLNWAKSRCSSASAYDPANIVKSK